VQNGQQGQFVFVIKSDMTVETRAVTINRTSSGESIIDTGLKPGERVVTDGQLRLVPGSRVEIKHSIASSAMPGSGDQPSASNAIPLQEGHA
jgi:multidrug efflux system membrane fusion protein